MKKLDTIASRQYLTEAITMADVQTAVGQEKDEQKRAGILNDLAWKNNLPGLYDPVSGYFVRKQSQPVSGEGSYSISATAREADTQALAKMGLVPSTAKTSALGGLVGVGKNSWGGLDKEQSAANDQASTDIKNQSAKVYGDQASAEYIKPRLEKLNALVAKISSAGAPSTVSSGAATQPAKEPEQWEKDSARQAEWLKSLKVQPTKLKAPIQNSSYENIAKSLIESFGYQLDEKVTLGTGPVVQKDVGNGMTISVGQYQSEVAEIRKLMGELGDVNDPAVEKALQAAQDALDNLEKQGKAEQPGGGTQTTTSTTPTAKKDPAAIDSPETQKKIARFKELLTKAGGSGFEKRTPAEIQASADLKKAGI